MTLSPNPTHSTDMTPKTRQQDHHLKAADLLAKASTCHEEAARFIQGGDHHAASSQAKLADEHTANAAHQAAQASRVISVHRMMK